MSLANHSLTVDGVSKTLQEWGAVAASCTVASQGIGHNDSLSVQIPRDFDDGFVFRPFANCILLDPEGNPRFHGVLVKLPVTASDSTQSHTYVFRDPWEYLQGIVYRQSIMVPLDPTVADSTLITAPLSKVILNVDNTTGAQVSVGDQIIKAMEYAIGAGAPVGYFIPSLGELGILPPADQQTDMFVGDVIDSQLRWIPAVTAFWDYSLPVPAMRFTKSLLTRVVQATDMEQFSADPRHDLLVRKLSINILNRQTVSAAPGIIWITVPTQDSVVENGSFREINMCIELREDDPPIGSGLAAALHAPFSQLTWQMTCQFVGQDVNWDYQVGESWVVPNVRGLSDGATGIVQQITRDLANGRTTVQCGYPRHLGLSDLLALVRKTRQRGYPENGSSFQTGKDTKVNNPALVVFDVIENGALARYKVSAERVPDPA